MFTRKFAKVATVTAGAVSLAVTLTACGSSGGSAKHTTGSATGLVSQAGTGARLSGINAADIFGAWIPNDLYPSSVSMQSPDYFDTGELVTTNSQWSWSKLDCSSATSKVAAPGFGEVSYLINEGGDSATKSYYTYSVYEFASADQATAFVKGAAAKLGSCGSFTVSGNGASVPVTLSLGPSSEAASVTSANVAVDVRESLTANGQNVVGDLLFAADGNIVVVTTSAATNTVPTQVNNATVADRILKGFTTGEAGSGAGGGSSSGTTGAGASSPAVGGGARIRAYSTDAIRFGGGAR